MELELARLEDGPNTRTTEKSTISRTKEDIVNIEKKWIRVLAKSDSSFGEKEPSQHECQPEGEALAWMGAGGSGPLAGWGRVS